ncbi:MAG TPA: hypothetical protein VF813_06265, partial [Anaerolineaceae bacterium]
MPIAAALRKSRWAEILLLGLLSLFFFQLLTAFIAAVYAFGLMGLNIPPEIACVLFLFAPLLLVFARRAPRGGWLAGLGAVMLACRVVEPLLPTRERMLVCGLGTGAGLLAFAGLLAGGEDARPDELSLGQGLALGVGLAALLRAAGGGLDLSTMGMFQGIGWALAVLAASLLLSRVAGGGSAAPSTGQPAGRPGSFWKAAGLSVGLGGGITLLYFAFTAPNVMARWMGSSAVLVFALAALALFGFAWLAASPDRLIWALRPQFLGPANAVFVLALALALRLQQVSYPAGPAGYPVYGPAGLGWQVLLLALAVLLFPVILLDFMLYTREIRCLSLTPRRAGASFSLAALFLLVLIFAQVFTTVYDYIPVVGPFFRDRFWLVFLAAGLGLALPLALVSGRQAAPHFQTASPARFLPSFLAAAGLASTAFAALASLPPAPAPSAETRLRVLTYNIQQGYSADGQKNYLGQLRVMRAADADIIGLQETDTSRIAGGNDDLVGFLASQL